MQKIPAEQLMPVTQEEKYKLCDATVTLDGHPAGIRGALLQLITPYSEDRW